MKKITGNKYLVIIGALAVGAIAGWLLKPSGDYAGGATGHERTTESVPQTWTCAMHPQVRQPEPGKCPICGMDLIPLEAGQEDTHPLEVKMSATAMQLASVQTSVITMKMPVRVVRLNGKVRADERAVSSQASHIPGRVEKLLVSFTGEAVHGGQVLAYIYSPQLVTAQEELFEAWKTRDSHPELYNAARGKLLNWKLTERQVDAFLEAGRVQEQFPAQADVSGVVLKKHVNPGDYVAKGQALFEIANLSRVWVLFDVYESDMPWIRKGLEVTFTVQSLPGESFNGKISFVDPVIHPRTRVSTARVEIINPGMKLKPEMFVVGLVESPVKGRKDALVVPKSAVMWTGERSVVYEKRGSESDIRFVMREVTLGPSLGDGFIVKDGLEEGVEIATHGTFSIDAAAQLAGKPSMMNRQGSTAPSSHHGSTERRGNNARGAGGHTVHVRKINAGPEAREALQLLFPEYLELKDALVADNLEAGKLSAGRLAGLIDGVDIKLLEKEAHAVWQEHRRTSGKILKELGKAPDIGIARQAFRRLSDRFIMLAASFGPFGQVLYIQHCPMANNDKGADWISGEKEIRNPYFGESMISCGYIISEVK